MKSSKIILFNTIFCCFFLINFNIFASNIVTININFIIENSISYSNFLLNLTQEKKIYQNKILIDENTLKEMDKEIKESELILSDEQIIDMKNKYNIQLDLFKEKVKNINNFFSSNIDNNKNILIKKIAEYMQIISQQNNFDLILTEDQYFMSSKNIDVSNKVIELLNNDLIKLEITNFNE